MALSRFLALPSVNSYQQCVQGDLSLVTMTFSAGGVRASQSKCMKARAIFSFWAVPPSDREKYANVSVSSRIKIYIFKTKDFSTHEGGNRVVQDALGVSTTPHL